MYYNIPINTRIIPKTNAIEDCVEVNLHPVNYFMKEFITMDIKIHDILVNFYEKDKLDIRIVNSPEKMYYIQRDFLWYVFLSWKEITKIGHCITQQSFKNQINSTKIFDKKSYQENKPKSRSRYYILKAKFVDSINIETNETHIWYDPETIQNSFEDKKNKIMNNFVKNKNLPIFTVIDSGENDINKKKKDDFIKKKIIENEKSKYILTADQPKRKNDTSSDLYVYLRVENNISIN